MAFSESSSAQNCMKIALFLEIMRKNRFPSHFPPYNNISSQFPSKCYFLPNFLPKAQISFWKEISFQMETLLPDRHFVTNPRKKNAFIGRHLGFGQVWACLLELSFQVIYSSLYTGSRLYLRTWPPLSRGCMQVYVGATA